MVTAKPIETPPIAGAKWLRCNGRQLKKMAKAGLTWLEKNRDHVNSLNVFPVPDGDTGTNMLLTMRSAYGRIEPSDELHVGKMAGQLAQGALMGARGNSGVILSQIWRGMAYSLSHVEAFEAADLARALQSASDTAYKGVMRPVEGTILTVIREGAAEAADALRKSQDLRFMLERVLERCQQTLEMTPEMLPILKQAGVVDSGGQGLVYLLEGMLRYAQGKLLLEGEAPGDAVQAAGFPLPAQAHAVPEGGELEFPYDVQFILTGRDLDVLEVRRRIDAMGDSTVVVGDRNVIKVHVHVKDPGRPLSYGAQLGAVSDVVVENMQAQMEEIVGRATPAEAPAPTTVTATGDVGVVAVASGAGLAEIFRSLGASYVVNGGQTNNPSTEEIYQAIQSVPADKVIVLPNNKNIFLAAEAARDLSAKQVAVIPTRSVPQGIAALLTLNPNGDLAAVRGTMEEAIAGVRTGEITRATRSVELDGVAVKQGALIGLLDGRLCATGEQMAEVIDQVMSQIAGSGIEIVTLYFGSEISAEAAAGTAERIRTAYPDIEVEVLDGGQSHYYYILGAE